jgi:protein-tyrosine phosphatase
MTSPDTRYLTPGTRHLPLEGAYNIRDLGGYETVDGRTTNWGKYLRSDTLANLPQASADALVAYGIRNIIDLRRSTELQFKPSPFIGSEAVTYYHQNMSGDVPLERSRELAGIEEQAERRGEIYCQILDQRKHILHQIFSILAQPDGLPALAHCNAGKDRAGIVAAFVLNIAGVPRETIVDDYALTAKYNVVRYVQDNPDLAANGYTWKDYQDMACDPRSMQLTLDFLDTNYGGVQGYLRDVGIADEQMNSIKEAMVE